MSRPPSIHLHDVREHNLAGISVAIPHGQLTVVTGVSGSGKSSLVFDALHAACERRYLETLSAHARRYLQRLPPPHLALAEHLSPSIALSQRRSADNPRSTVGTLSGVHDLLRLCFARATGREARDFSFVTAGACPACRGIGSTDRVARDLLIADPSKTLRQGALVPTTPTGYIVYSQVTVDALDTVCRAHGFDVDTPWQDLTREQQDVVFFGSDRVEVPFGKHALASRMKWQGIKAKPRELGHYKGLIPTITDILQRSRNENALRFARSLPCEACGGSRLNEAARAARIGEGGDEVSIADALAWPLPQLLAWTNHLADETRPALQRRLAALLQLGLGHLSCDRATASLSGGEHQRVRLGAMATAGMAGVTFVFDEPSIGLHASEERAVLDLLCALRDAGNTVVVVEHSEQALRCADHLIDLGPGAGVNGGRVLFAGSPDRLAVDAAPDSRTRAHYATDDDVNRGGGGKRAPALLRERRATASAAWLEVLGASARNLRDVDVRFALGRLNVIAGVAGAGKSTLVAEVLAAAVRARIDGRPLPAGLRALRGGETLQSVVHVDQAPIGRTPRSNPATYTGLFDDVRRCFAALPAAREHGFTATTFSFNTKDGGRCPACEGSGREVVGMHGLPDVELVCGVCRGRRFQAEVLAVRYHDRHSILEVLESTVDDARAIFADRPKVDRVLDALQRVGLGYLTLGQPATTLSGGEAQRVKLAGELARAGGGPSLFVLEEPTIGLHRDDIATLLTAFDELVQRGHTVVLVEHDLDVIRTADHIVELGPGAGDDGGTVCGSGTADELAELDTPTGRCLRGLHRRCAASDASAARARHRRDRPIELRGVSTHNLHDVDVDVPSTGLTVVTGVSGSGKSSLVFDTLHGESRARFTEHLSGHLRRQLGPAGRARALRHADGLRPTIALAQHAEADARKERRATVATTAELHALLRTLWSRLAARDGVTLPAAAFSFFQHEGACPGCAGVGTVLRCDPDRLIVAPERPLYDGALDAKNKAVRDYAEPQGRYRAVLDAVGRAHGHDWSVPYHELSEPARQKAMYGCGDEQFDAVWEHVGAEGEEPHRFRTQWRGIAGEVDAEFARRQASGTSRTEAFDAVLAPRTCELCEGDRLAEPARSMRVAGLTLPELCRRDVHAVLALMQGGLQLDEAGTAIATETCSELERRLQRLAQLGLGHLQLNRGTGTLSAGERQRLRLARQLAAPLYGSVYVLDEPTLGLHPRDVEALLSALRGLVDAGNAVIAVEHDLAMTAAADHVIEVGPGAGADGGRIVAAAAPCALPSGCRTARLLGSLAQLEPRATRRHDDGHTITIAGARLHHLQQLTVTLPAGCLTAVTGVSGSGKSSLVRGVLAASADRGRAVGCDAVTGLDAFAFVTDDAAARTLRVSASCPAVWLDLLDEVRRQFARTDGARQHGFRASHFAYLGKSGGACRACGGLGRVRSEFDLFGTAAWSPCEVCNGLRYDEATRAVRWLDDLGIADVLAATVDELWHRLGDHLADLPKIERPLRVARELGLGYLRLGQGADTLSGGEAQRLGLAVRLATPTAQPGLFLLDEPTRGLHPDDVTALLAALDRLVAAGHTIVVVEHDLTLIAHADHVVDLGPGAGEAGGRLVFAGSPAGLAQCASSATGQALRNSGRG